MSKKFEILFFEKNKNKPTEKFLLNLTKSTISKVLRILDLLENYGPLIGMPYVKKVNSKLYELRIRGKEEVRFLFTYHGNLIRVLHGFKKKKQKIPQKEIKIAFKRLTSI